MSDEIPKVLVVMPFYGKIDPAAARSYYRCATDNKNHPHYVEVVDDIPQGLSLLQHNFNFLLAAALDLRDAGVVTHLAMQHSDIEPKGNWVNDLWSVMRRQDAEFVSAVSPIKNDEGLTSTAIGVVDDPWKIRRYIKVADRATLPGTFGPADVCAEDEILLVNTGLWLADLRAKWWDAPVNGGDCFAFDIRTRIVRPNGGRRVPQCRPEDWELSRHMHRHGARYYATWHVRLNHIGDAEYASHPDLM